MDIDLKVCNNKRLLVYKNNKQYYISCFRLLESFDVYYRVNRIMLENIRGHSYQFVVSKNIYNKIKSNEPWFDLPQKMSILYFFNHFRKISKIEALEYLIE